MRFGAQNSRGKISVHPSGRHSNKISLLRVVESAPLTNALEVYPTLFHMNGGSIITLSSSFVCSPNAPDTQWPRRKTSNCHWHQCCRPSHVRADTYLIVQFDKTKKKKKREWSIAAADAQSFCRRQTTVRGELTDMLLFVFPSFSSACGLLVKHADDVIYRESRSPTDVVILAI